MIRPYISLLPLTLALAACPAPSPSVATDSTPGLGDSIPTATAPDSSVREAAVPQAGQSAAPFFAHGGWTLGERTRPDGSTASYGAAYTTEGGRLKLWLDTLSYVVDPRRPSSHIVDSLDGGPILGEETLTFECRITAGEGEGGEIVGVVRSTATAYVPPQRGWRFDLALAKIRELPADSLSCVAPEAID